jgi:hypothetical protein
MTYDVASGEIVSLPYVGFRLQSAIRAPSVDGLGSSRRETAAHMERKSRPVIVGAESQYRSEIAVEVLQSIRDRADLERLFSASCVIFEFQIRKEPRRRA